MDLDTLGRSHGSDKSSLGHDYLRFYESYIAPLRNAEITLLEFGHNDGSSLAMWRAYLPRARIIGVFPDHASLPGCPEIVEIEVGDQRDPTFLTHLASKYRPTIIIDDGLHFWAGQQLSLQRLYEVVAPDGVYIVEDLHTSVGGEMREIYGGGAACSTLSYLLGLAEALAGPLPPEIAEAGSFTDEFTRQTASICFHAKACAIQKATRWHALVAVRPARDVTSAVEELNNGGPYRRLPAQIINCPRPLLDRFQTKVDSAVAHAPPAAIVELEDVTVHGEGIIVTSEGDVIAESLINTETLPSFGPFIRDGSDARLRMRRDPPIHERLTGGNFVLLKQTWDANFGHWLVESLPRVDLVAERYDLSSCRFIVSAAGAMRQLYVDTLTHFGINENQIIWTGNQSFTVDRLIYPLPMTVQPWVKAPRVLRVLERLATRDAPAWEPTSRLYVSRNNIGRRRLLNEEQIIEILAPRGYAIVNPETLTFADQVRLFREASIVIGNLGAGLTNLVFSGPGVTLFALTSEFMQDDFFWDILCHKQGRYISLHGQAADPGLGMQSDFTVDVGKFREVLDGLGPL